MARVKSGPRGHQRHRKIIKMAKGYYDRKGTCYRVAIEAVEKALKYAYRDRRRKKRDFRRLWIQRINAAARENGLTYSQFMFGVKCAQINLDRKVLSDIAVRDPESFKAIFTQAKAAAEKAKKAA